MDAEWNVRVLQGIGKTEFSGSVVHRISAEDKERADFSGPKISDEILDRLELIDRVRVYGFGVEDGLAYIAQRLIDRMYQRVHSGRLVVSGNHYAGSPMRL